MLTHNHQTGSALIISLIILILMTLIGTTGMQTTVMEEKMAGNTRDQNNAFQAAEAGLRDGEQDIETNAYAITDFDANEPCSKPLCKTDNPYTERPWLSTDDWTNTETRVYGAVTSIAALKGVANQPRYLIEELPDAAGGGSLSIGGGPYGGVSTGLYRITAQGYGAAMDDVNSPLARVMLQTVYRN